MNHAQPAFVTIVTNDYLHWARGLFASVRSVYGPERRCIAYVIGELPPEAGERTLGFELVRCEDLALDAFWDMAFRYTPLELSCALKPRVFAHALENLGLGELIYLDSDIIVVSRFDEAERMLSDGATMVATPHIIAPHRGPFVPGNLVVLRAGRLNAGFIAVRRDGAVMAFLRWWAQVVQTESIYDLSRGYFVDQSWFQHAPSFVSGFAELRNPGYNLAPWNIDLYRLAQVDGTYLVDDTQPLRFFHWSGADLDDPGKISRHLGPAASELDLRLLGGLLERHAALLQESRRIGSTDLGALEYAYAAFRDGTPIPPSWRRAYAEIFSQSQSLSRGELFDAGGHPANSRAADVTVHDGIHVSELMKQWWQADSCLQALFDIQTPEGQCGLRALLDHCDERHRLRQMEAGWVEQVRSRQERINVISAQVENIAREKQQVLAEVEKIAREKQQVLAEMEKIAREKQQVLAEMERRSHALRYLVRSLWRETLDRIFRKAGLVRSPP